MVCSGDVCRSGVGNNFGIGVSSEIFRFGDMVGCGGIGFGDVLFSAAKIFVSFGDGGGNGDSTISVFDGAGGRGLY